MCLAFLLVLVLPSSILLTHPATVRSTLLRGTLPSRQPPATTTSYFHSNSSYPSSSSSSSLSSSLSSYPSSSLLAPSGRRRLMRLSSGAQPLLQHCAAPTATRNMDVVYVVHSKDIGPLEWSVRTLLCRCPDLRRIHVVSDDSASVHSLVSSLNEGASSGEGTLSHGKEQEEGQRVVWVDEKVFPFNVNDVARHFSCHNKCGWYLQQLLKMYAGRVIPGLLDYLVVDADVVWFKELTMIAGRGDDGRPSRFYYDTAAQHVAPYFQQINRLTGGQVHRVDRALSGVSHHMVFKLDVLEELLKHVEKLHDKPFWKAVLDTVDPKAGSGFSEYELYFNFALLYHTETAEVRHLTFANGPNPKLMYIHGDESRMAGPVWGHGNFEKQMMLDLKHGFDFVGYHSYAKRRYYDVPAQFLEPYCKMLGVAQRNSDIARRCNVPWVDGHPQGKEDQGERGDSTESAGTVAVRPSL